MPQRGRRKNKMNRYDINTYDFVNDEKFQAFLKKKIGDECIPKDKFMRKLNAAKKEWIKILNSPILRHVYKIDFDVE